MELKESDFIESAKNKVAQLKIELKKWELYLDAALKVGHNPEKSNQLSFLPDPPVRKDKKTSPSGKMTVKQKVTEILKEADMLLTSRELMEAVNQKYQDKQYKDMSSWSGAFASMYLKPDSGINKYELKKQTLELKALYGLAGFFVDGKEVKPDYKEKIIKRYEHL